MSRLVYVVERFPQQSQTFIQNEVRELTRLRVLPRVVALYPVRGADQTATDLAHDVLPSAWRAKRRLAAALLRLLLRHPVGLIRAVVVAARRPTRLQLHALAKAILLLDLLGNGPPPARIHAHFARASASTAMLAAAALRCRFSFTAHAVDIFVHPFDVDRKLRAADVAITVCEYNRRWMAGRWPGAGVIEVVPCGVHPEQFRRSSSYRRQPFTVVAVGRLVPKKGFDVLVEACARLVADGIDVRCRIVGDGPERGRLLALVDARGLGDRVEVGAFLSPPEVRGVLEDATVFCLPCVVAPDGDRDSQPVVVKEAMAMELPVVVTEEVGLPEVVDDGVGRLVPPGDPEALAAALADLHAAPEADLRRVGRAGRRRIEAAFTTAQQAAGLLACWDRAERRRHRWVR